MLDHTIEIHKPKPEINVAITYPDREEGRNVCNKLHKVVGRIRDAAKNINNEYLSGADLQEDAVLTHQYKPDSSKIINKGGTQADLELNSDYRLLGQDSSTEQTHTAKLVNFLKDNGRVAKLVGLLSQHNVQQTIAQGFRTRSNEVGEIIAKLFDQIPLNEIADSSEGEKGKKVRTQFHNTLSEVETKAVSFAAAQRILKEKVGSINSANADQTVTELLQLSRGNVDYALSLMELIAESANTLNRITNGFANADNPEILQQHIKNAAKTYGLDISLIDEERLKIFFVGIKRLASDIPQTQITPGDTEQIIGQNLQVRRDSTSADGIKIDDPAIDLVTNLLESTNQPTLRDSYRLMTAMAKRNLLTILHNGGKLEDNKNPAIVSNINVIANYLLVGAGIRIDEHEPIVLARMVQDILNLESQTGFELLPELDPQSPYAKIDDDKLYSLPTGDGTEKATFFQSTVNDPGQVSPLIADKVNISPSDVLADNDRADKKLRETMLALQKNVDELSVGATHEMIGRLVQTELEKALVQPDAEAVLRISKSLLHEAVEQTAGGRSVAYDLNQKEPEVNTEVKQIVAQEVMGGNLGLMGKLKARFGKVNTKEQQRQVDSLMSKIDKIHMDNPSMKSDDAVKRVMDEYFEKRRITQSKQIVAENKK